MAKFPKQNLRNGLKAVINNWLSIKKKQRLTTKNVTFA